MQVSLSDGLHGFVALKVLSGRHKPYPSSSISLLVSLVTTRNGIGMSPRINLTYLRSRYIGAGLVLSDLRFLDSVQYMLVLAETFEIAYGVPFVAPRTNDILADLQASKLLNRADRTSVLRHIFIAKFLLLYPAALC